jgi:hypothetical protein
MGIKRKFNLNNLGSWAGVKKKREKVNDKNKENVCQWQSVFENCALTLENLSDTNANHYGRQRTSNTSSLPTTVPSLTPARKLHM